MHCTADLVTFTEEILNGKQNFIYCIVNNVILMLLLFFFKRGELSLLFT